MKFIYFTIFSLLVLSCSEYEEPEIYYPVQAGSIYCSDGSLISPLKYTQSGKSAIGVVFWVNDYSNSSIKESAFAVALNDLNPTYLINKLENISGVSESETAYDGAANTASFFIYASTNNIPAAAIENTYSFKPYGVGGWYIPSSAQTKLINKNIDKVYSSFEVCGGNLFSQWYWTSTEDGTGKQTASINAFIVALDKGTISTSLKTNIFKVRPIISIR